MVTLPDPQAPVTVTIPSYRMDDMRFAHVVGAVESNIHRGAKVFIFDLSELDFLDSETLALVIATKLRLQGAGGEVRLVLGGASHRAILRMTRFEQYFELHESVLQAHGGTGKR